MCNRCLSLLKMRVECVYIVFTLATIDDKAIGINGAFDLYAFTKMYLRAWVAQCVRQLDYLKTHTSLSPIPCGFATDFVNYKKVYSTPSRK